MIQISVNKFNGLTQYHLTRGDKVVYDLAVFEDEACDLVTQLAKLLNMEVKEAPRGLCHAQILVDGAIQQCKCRDGHAGSHVTEVTVSPHRAVIDWS